MAILTSSQQTFVDITDQRKLSAYITSNLPKTQAEDPNTLPHTYAPSWKTTNLQLTPVVFLDQTSVPLGSTGLTISWRRKDGVAAETNLITGESASSGILTVNKDVLADSDSGMITYICYISYYDAETKNTVNITSDITYTLVKDGETAKLAYVTADSYVFKYDSAGSLVGAAQATLTAQVQGVTVSKSQYKAWTCRSKNGKGGERNGKGRKCSNHMIQEEILLQQIAKKMGWDAFDETLFHETVDCVVIGKKGIKVELKENE